MLQFPSSNSLPQATLDAVSSPLLDPTERLNTTLEELSRAHLELERARYEADEIPPGTPPDQIEQVLRKQRTAYRRWFEIQQQATQLESEARRRQLESLHLYKQRFQQTYDDLYAQYGDLGPHYRILVERASAIDARINIIENSGRDLDTSEIVELNKLHTSLVNQLQRYTEATKTESLTRQTQETIQQLMIIIEHRVAPSNPTLWREIVHDVRQTVEQLQAG
jgi:hypothetical protein